MKKISLTVALLLASFTLAQAQWISPGNGTTYSMNDLVAESDGCVEFVEEGTFRINNDLTISENDILAIADNESIVMVKDQVTITIQGTFSCAHHDNYVEIKTENNEHYNLRFENATDCMLSGIKFKYGGGFMIIESNVLFDDCYFVHSNTQSNNAAVNYMNCNPVFKGCTFKNNDGAAIASGVNVNGSPTIVDCYFYNNVITNQNLPQINLGPGAEDTIRIVNNVIEGNHYSMSGGIAITDLMGTGSTKVLLKGNEIKNNRYGYNQQGMVISSLITDNLFIDNDAEVDPMNGGSGISIYGYSTDMKAKLRRNTITGNLWGITAIYYNDIDMGTEDDWGYNIISDRAKEATAKLRTIQGKTQRQNFKAKNFDYVTPAGTFSIRNAADIIEPSGYMVIDVDDLNTQEQVEATFQMLLGNRRLETLLLFRSPSGNGVKWIIRIVNNEGHDYLYFFKAVTNYLGSLGIKVDQSGKDISRACYLPHDPNAYINELCL